MLNHLIKSSPAERWSKGQNRHVGEKALLPILRCHPPVLSCPGDCPTASLAANPAVTSKQGTDWKTWTVHGTVVPENDPPYLGQWCPSRLRVRLGYGRSRGISMG